MTEKTENNTIKRITDERTQQEITISGRMTGSWTSGCISKTAKTGSARKGTNKQ